METMLLLLFGLGTVVLIGLGLVTLFFGITADEAADFPFARYSWLRPLAACAVMAVAPGWLVILSNSVGAWLLFGGFFAASMFILWHWRRGLPA
jgi:lysylphosphatidylglycerol synthetase-like protein (DUF2156 family)